MAALVTDGIPRSLRGLDKVEPRRAFWVAFAAAGLAGAALAAGGVAGWVAFALLTGAMVPLAWSGRPVAIVEPPELLELLDMVELPGGEFLMGERPGVPTVVSAFAIGRVPVTQAQVREILGESPGEPAGEELPVNNVSWHDAVRFCNALSVKAGMRPCYVTKDDEVRWDRTADGYRLPTEAEWEYACRAGTTTGWFFGDDPVEAGRYAWFDEGVDGQVHPVGTKLPNPWGLLDMAGNVWEWCWDWYGDLPKQRTADPSGPEAGGGRVLRGGSFWDDARNLRSANWGRGGPGGRGGDIGFRCVRSARPQPRPSSPWPLSSPRARSARAAKQGYNDN